MATGISRPRTRVSAGTTTKPPPTPKKPVSRPTAVAVTPMRRAAARRGAGRAASGDPEAVGDAGGVAAVRAGAFSRSRHARTSITAATASISPANAVIRTVGFSDALQREPRNVPAVPSPPNAAPAPQRTRPARA